MNTFLLVVYVGAAIYLLAMFALLYFCVYSDPSDSAVGRFLTQTVPSKSWELAERLLPKRLSSVVEFVLFRALAIFYLAAMCGSWSIIVFFIIPLIHEQDIVAPFHQYTGGICFVCCLASWRQASSTSPGVLTKDNLSRYEDNYPFDELLFISGLTCRSTGVPRLARSKYDRYKYHGVIPRFDHFCGWLNNTVGQENYRWFLLFLAVHVFSCGYGAYMVTRLFYGRLVRLQLWDATFVDRTTGETFEATYFLLMQYVMDNHLAASFVVILMGVMSVALALFFSYHVFLTCRGMTTNESYKWDEVHKWYRKELQRYKDAYGTVDPKLTETLQTRPSVPDGDVTCTGGAAVVSSIGDMDGRIIHPGPKPHNVYNRGIVENWKEVIFPLSLRSWQKKTKIT